MESVPCDPDRECRYRDTAECYIDEHHLYWPRRSYRDSVGRAFRNHPDNKVDLCRQVHQDIHATQGPPKKPKRTVMLGVLNANQ